MSNSRLPTDAEILQALAPHPKDLDGLVKTLRPTLWGQKGSRTEAHNLIEYVRDRIGILCALGHVKTLFTSAEAPHV